MKKLMFILTMIMGVTLYGVQYEKAIFAGGCFWCMEKPFEEIVGVESVISGYTGGTI